MESLDVIFKIQFEWAQIEIFLKKILFGVYEYLLHLMAFHFLDILLKYRVLNVKKKFISIER